MNDKPDSQFFSQVTEKMIRNRNVFGAALCVENGDRSVSWAGSSGDINENDCYFMLVPSVKSNGYPSVMALCLAGLLVLIPFQLGVLIYEKKCLYRHYRSLPDEFH